MRVRHFMGQILGVNTDAQPARSPLLLPKIKTSTVTESKPYALHRSAAGAWALPSPKPGMYFRIIGSILRVRSGVGRDMESQTGFSSDTIQGFEFVWPDLLLNYRTRSTLLKEIKHKSLQHKYQTGSKKGLRWTKLVSKLNWVKILSRFKKKKTQLKV